MRARSLVAPLLLSALASCGRGDPPATPSIPDPDARDVPETVIVEALGRGRHAVEQAPDSAAAWGAYGDFLVHYGWAEEGEACYRQAQILAPGAFEWPYRLGVTLLDEDLDAAATAIRRALEIDPDYAPAHVRLAKLLGEEGQPDLARQHYQRAAELDGSSIDAHLGLARLCLAGKRLEDARKELEIAADLGAKNAAVHELLAKVLFAQGEEEEARRHADRARRLAAPPPLVDPRAHAELPPLSSRDFLNEGVERIRARQFEEAMKDFRRALELKPDFVEAHYNLALALAFREQYAESAEHLRDVLRLRPGYPEARVQLGKILKNMGNLAEARQVFLEVLQEDPESLAANRELGHLYYQMDRNFDEALKYSSRAVSLDPEDADLRYQLAFQLMEARRYEDAVQQFRECLRLEPSYSQARNNLGIMLGLLDRNDEAIATFREAMESNPGDEDARTNLATAVGTYGLKLLDEGEWTAAATRMEEALALRQDWAFLQYNLAWILANTPEEDGRDPARALQIVEELRQKNPEEDVFELDVLASTLAASGRFSEAADVAARAARLARDAGHEGIAQRIEARLEGYRRGEPYRLSARGRRTP